MALMPDGGVDREPVLHEVWNKGDTDTAFRSYGSDLRTPLEAMGAFFFAALSRTRGLGLFHKRRCRNNT